ncbi:glycosyl hydrolase family 65 protein [Caballeronia sordidicola]|uniref:Trehalose-6-phosphate phosphatase n=1 Tax=Caballeronia sordidicola TaxID=196367 RepID=A0A226WU73_CABSO|nr:glycosyl hydrolase family 65 protein [Caballeronia sordidicola]OXC74746.1 Trehalose-6-phosphate phosphatase [Caballeronia sordidicola]
MISYPVVTLSPRDYDAVLFDLDGVLAKTANLHACARKQLLGNLLEQHDVRTGMPSVPFNIDADYARYADGKSRYDGVAAFLAAHEIHLPVGSRDDGPEVQSQRSLGKLESGYFLQNLNAEGVELYDASIQLVRKLRALNIRTGAVSFVGNCAEVLEAAGIAKLFDTTMDCPDVDGGSSDAQPEFDVWRDAVQRLGADISRVAVITQWVAGIEADHAGRFGCVIGVDRGGRTQELRDAGADVVVTDSSQVQATAEPPPEWSLVFTGFEPAHEGVRETLCTLGNGYFATRAAAPWCIADDVHYPGTYLACAYNRLHTDIAGRVVENEDLVNLPNWLQLKFRIGTEDWFDTRAVTLSSYRQELDLRRGMLLRSISFEDDKGRRSTLNERRFVSMRDTHLGALELTLTAHDWSAPVTVRSSIDARIVNSGAKLYRKFNNKHIEPLGAQVIGTDGVVMNVRTSQSHVNVSQASRTQATHNGMLLDLPRGVIEEPGYIGHEFCKDLVPGESLVVNKIAALYSSRDPAISECGFEARKAVSRAGSFDELAAAHALTWKHLWRRFDVRIEPADPSFKLNVSMLLRLNMFHLLQAVSPNSIGLDIGVPARGWTGEGYQGHIFWDELFIFPFFNYRLPEITRSLLMYRYRRLGEARAAAAAAGYAGAMFPWQSGSDGSEETQAFNLNPRSQHWVLDNSYLQRHVGSAIAYNVWQYFQVTHDVEFLYAYGAELILDIARFWSSISKFNPASGRFEIHGVLGPDEFHDGYPGSKTPGVNNNAYTNVMAVWVLRRARDVLDLLPEIRRAELMIDLDLTSSEIDRWDEIGRKMVIPFHDEGIISQFEGYEKLRELDWDGYRARYSNIQRLDLILEGEGDSANGYKLSKQPDTLMLFFLFSAEELTELFLHLGYPFPSTTIPRNVDYYTDRSSDGSTLSRVVNAWVLARSDRPRSMRFFAQALQSDVADIQDGTTAEGVHLGAMAGTVDIVQRVWTGIEIKDDVLRFKPQLPHDIDHLELRIRYRGHSIEVRLDHDTLTLHAHTGAAAPISLLVGGQTYELKSGSTRVVPLTTQATDSTMQADGA